MRKHQKTKKRNKTIVLGLATCLIILTFFGGATLINHFLNRYPKNLVNINKGNKKIGDIESELFENEHGYFAYYYPKTEYDSINLFANKEIEKEKQENSSLVSSDIASKNEFLEDYEIEEIAGKYISLNFTKYLNGMKRNNIGRVFDITKDQIISLRSLLTEKGERKVIYDLRKKIQENNSWSEVIKKTKLDENLNWKINEEVMVIYIDNQEVEFSLNDIAHYFKEPFKKTDMTEEQIPIVYIDREVRGDDKLIALTFDDGPHKINTPELLSYLKDQSVSATFFSLGERVEMFPEITKKVLENGHQVAAHTYTHPNLNKLSAQEIQDEMVKTRKALLKATGFQDKPMVRPPYGNANQFVLDNSDEVYINWSVDTNDWRNRDSYAVCQEVIKNAHDGAIVLMHDLYSSTIEGVKCMIPELKKRGYSFVTVQELLNSRGIPIVEKKIYNDGIK